jgi:hypothetical protein
VSFIAASLILGGAAVVGAGAAVYAGHEQAQGQKQAARTQQGFFDTINQQEQPFIQGGYGAQARLNDLLGTTQFDAGGMPLDGGLAKSADYGSLTKSFGPQDFLDNVDPGYQFRLDTGAQATRNADTPGVGALSGPALKDLMNFNQASASQEYGNSFSRFQTQQTNIFNRLNSIAGLGQNAATQTGNAGASLGSGIAQAQAAAAGSQAAGAVGAANSIGKSANTLAGIYAYGAGGGEDGLAGAFSRGLSPSS